MNRRAVIWLALVAAIVAIAAVWVDQRPIGGVPVADGGKLWPDLDAQLNQITEIRLSRGDGSRVSLQRKTDGWQVAERHYPADAGKIRKLLLDIAALNVVEEKTSDPKKYAVLGIDTPSTPAASGTLIELVKSGTSPAFALIAGKSAGSREIYARRPGDKAGLLLRPTLIAEALPARWLDATLLDIKDAEIRSLKATPATGAPWSLARAAPTATTMTLDGGAAKAAPDSSVVTGLLGSFAALTLEDVRASAAPAAAATDRLELQTFAGLTLGLEGIHDGDKHWVRLSATGAQDSSRAAAERIQAVAAGHEFEIPAWKYDAIFKKRDEVAPTPPRG